MPPTNVMEASFRADKPDASQTAALRGAIAAAHCANRSIKTELTYSLTLSCTFSTDDQFRTSLKRRSEDYLRTHW